LKITIQIFVLFLSISNFQVNAQNLEIIDDIRQYRLDSATTKLNNLNTDEQILLGWQIELLKNFDISNPKYDSILNITKPESTELAKFYYYINLGDYHYYKHLDKNIIALDSYKEALELAQNQQNKTLICEALKKILKVHRISYLYDNETYIPYLNLYNDSAYDGLENAYYDYYNLILNFKNYIIKNWNSESYKRLSNYLNTNNQPYLRGVSYTIIASYFEELNNIDSSFYYINKSEKAFSDISYNYKGSRLNALYTFKARVALKNGKLNLAQEALTNAKKHQFNKTDFQNTSRIHWYKSLLDTTNNDYKSAFKELVRYDVIQDSIKAARFSDLLSELETKYETEKKEKENIQLQTDIATEKRNKRNIWIGFIVISIFGSITFFLIQKDTRRKQKIAEQEKKLETQKLATVLKEQELTAIDAMIEGQEKERQRIANELHDDLGGLMATVKLHFNALKDKKSPELFEKTNLLIDEAYEKVRTVAHAKNSGVIANQGLLKAIQEMAIKVSGTNKTVIEVVDYGLENRLENSLELTIFRIIQELTTNVIKHAEASEATIHITNHEDSLNLMVEDNGNGFYIKDISKNSGMGIHSIDKRIENLGGTVIIESEIDKGTTVIIDIPT